MRAPIVRLSRNATRLYHWIERGSEGTARYRGNGLPLMQALMDTVELTHDNGSGTSVRMARSLSPDRVPAEA